MEIKWEEKQCKKLWDTWLRNKPRESVSVSRATLGCYQNKACPKDGSLWQSISICLFTLVTLRTFRVLPNRQRWNNHNRDQRRKLFLCQEFWSPRTRLNLHQSHPTGTSYPTLPYTYHDCCRTLPCNSGTLLYTSCNVTQLFELLLSIQHREDGPE